MGNLLKKNHVRDGFNRSKSFTLDQIAALSTAAARDISILADAINEITENGNLSNESVFANGMSGLVPAPQAGDESKFLRGDGTWATVESGGASIAVFTGATTNHGTSGLVPAPQAGDETKFLRGDGSWSTVESGGASYADATTVSSGLMSATDKAKLDGLNNYTLPTASTTTKGGVKIGSGLSMDGDTLSVTLQGGTPSSGGTVLDTVPSTVDGGLWYEVNNNVPTLKLHAGNYNYSFKHDLITYKGDNSHLVAYLPFDVSTTDDACGNEWTASGSPTIADGACSFNGSSYLVNETISAAIGDSPWTVDFWATPSDTTTDRFFFSTFNANYGTTGMVIKGWVHLNWHGGNVEYGSYGDDHNLNLRLAPNVRHHFALVYDGTEKFVFVDGVLKGSYAENVELGGKFFIGVAPANDVGIFAGTIDHFRVFKGVALWTSNFTLPTANDYL